MEEWSSQENKPCRPRKLTTSNVGAVVDSIFSMAYSQATKTERSLSALVEGEESSSSDLSSASAVGSEASSLKSSQNGTSAPPSLNSSLTNGADYTALIESIMATLSHISADKNGDASSRRSSQSDLSNPPSLSSSASYVDSSATSVAVVESILASIFDP